MTETVFPILRGVVSAASKDVLEFMYSMTKTMHSMLENLEEHQIRKTIYVTVLNNILQEIAVDFVSEMVDEKKWETLLFGFLKIC